MSFVTDYFQINAGAGKSESHGVLSNLSHTSLNPFTTLSLRSLMPVVLARLPLPAISKTTRARDHGLSIWP